METLFVRNPLDSCRGRGTCGIRRRVTPTQRRRRATTVSLRPLTENDIPIRLTLRIEVDAPNKKESHETAP
jgi:hypothetical protein